MSLSEAQERAEAVSLDLIEVAPDATPPVCKILDAGKLAYEQSKKAKHPSRAVTRTKTIKLHMRISAHDLGLKCDHISKFLDEGKQVQVVAELVGRERAMPNQAVELLYQVLDHIGCEGEVRGGPNRASILLSPANKISPQQAAARADALAAEQREAVDEGTSDS